MQVFALNEFKSTLKHTKPYSSAHKFPSTRQQTMEYSGDVYTLLKELVVKYDDRNDDFFYIHDWNDDLNQYITDNDGKSYRIDDLPNTLRLYSSPETPANMNARVVKKEEIYYATAVVFTDVPFGETTVYIESRKTKNNGKSRFIGYIAKVDMCKEHEGLIPEVRNAVRRLIREKVLHVECCHDLLG